MEETPNFSTSWAYLERLAGDLESDTVATTARVRTELASLDRRIDELRARQRATWPRQVIERWTLWRNPWRRRARRLLADHQRETRAEWRASIRAVIDQLRRDEKRWSAWYEDQREPLLHYLAESSRAWERLNERVEKFAKPLAESRSAAAWLYNLPLSNLNRPRRWIARWLSLGRRGTHYTRPSWRSVRRAKDFGRHAVERLRPIRAWVPDPYVHQIELELLKLEAYQALLRPRARRLQALAGKMRTVLAHGTAAPGWAAEIAELERVAAEVTRR